jgi:hypothetical protein
MSTRAAEASSFFRSARHRYATPRCDAGFTLARNAHALEPIPARSCCTPAQRCSGARMVKAYDHAACSPFLARKLG